MRNLNAEKLLFASAARTDDPNTGELKAATFVNDFWTYAIFIINTTAAGVSPSTVFYVQAIDELGATYDILASTAVTGTGKVTLSIGPGLPVTANVSVNAILPYRLRLFPDHTNATSHTYSARVHLIGG